MIFNESKTFLFIVNFTKIYQFRPILKIPGAQDNLGFKDSFKLLGYWLTSDMRPATHVKYILKIAYQKIWSIRRLKANGISNEDILYFYSIKIRSILEYSCPIFQPMITQENRDDLERIQKIVLKILLGPAYKTYPDACQQFDIDSLEDRRSTITLNFALKCSKSEKFSALFPLNPQQKYEQRTAKEEKFEKFRVPFCNTERYRKSPIPYMISLLNKEFNQTK